MVQSLKFLAENTLIRDILFPKNSCPIISFCQKSNDTVNFETQFKYRGEIYNTNDSVFIPNSIGNEVNLIIICFYNFRQGGGMPTKFSKCYPLIQMLSKPYLNLFQMSVLPSLMTV